MLLSGAVNWNEVTAQPFSLLNRPDQCETLPKLTAHNAQAWTHTKLHILYFLSNDHTCICSIIKYNNHKNTLFDHQLHSAASSNRKITFIDGHARSGGNRAYLLCPKSYIFFNKKQCINEKQQGLTILYIKGLIENMMKAWEKMNKSPIHTGVSHPQKKANHM